MRQFTALWVLILGSACSSHEPSSARTSAVEPPDASAANEIRFSSGEYDLAPGDEKYLCWAGNLPADRQVLIRKISGDYGAGTHHVFFAWTLTPEPDGLSECPVLFKTTWIPIYLGGKNTSPLQLPDGAGIDMGQGKQLVLQLHLQNTSTETIKDHVTMHMQLGEPGVSYDPAGIFGLDNRVIALPPGAESTHTAMSCKPGKEMRVFSVLGHMHKLGKALQISHNEKVVYEETWNFDEQPITPFQMLVGKDDTVGLDCTHSNTRDHVVTYGESSDTEMCATIFYYTPYDRLAGCVNLPPAGDAGVKAVGDGGTAR